MSKDQDKISKLQTENEQLKRIINLKLELFFNNFPKEKLDADFIIGSLVDYIVLFRNNELDLVELGALTKVTQIPEIETLEK